MNNRLEELAFLIENDPNFLDREGAVPVLHALDRTLAGRTSTMPKDCTYADLWIAKKGNPLASMDAALQLMNETAKGAALDIKSYPAKNEVVVVLVPQGDIRTDSLSVGVAANMQAALTAAILKHVEKEGRVL